MILGIFAVMAVGLIFWLNKLERKSDQITIGAMMQLTGNGAIYGNDMKRGIDLAYNESDIKERITLVYEDDAGDTRKSIDAFNSFIARNIDIVIGGTTSNVANGILPIANRNKVLVLSPKATDPKLSVPDDYFFRIWPTDDVDGMVSAQFITDDLNLKRVAVFYPNVDYGVGIRNVFVDHLKSKNVQIVFDSNFANGATDFRTQILQIKEAEPDVLFLPAYFVEAVIILKQLNELNCDFYIAGISTFYEKEIINSSGKLKEKVFFTYPLDSLSSQNPATIQFVEKYKSYYNELPNAFIAHGYDSFKVLEQNIKQLLENKQMVTSENLKEAFENMEIFHGVTGDFRFDINGDVTKDLQIIWLRDI